MTSCHRRTHAWNALQAVARCCVVCGVQRASALACQVSAQQHGTAGAAGRVCQASCARTFCTSSTVSPWPCMYSHTARISSGVTFLACEGRLMRLGPAARLSTKEIALEAQPARAARCKSQLCAALPPRDALREPHRGVGGALAVWPQRVEAVGIHRMVQDARALPDALDAQVLFQERRARHVHALELALPASEGCEVPQASAPLQKADSGVTTARSAVPQLAGRHDMASVCNRTREVATLARS